MTLVTVEQITKFQENRGRTNLTCVGVLVSYPRPWFSRLLSISLFLVAAVSLAAARDLAVVSNKTNSVSSLTLPDLVKVCKGQTPRWPDGKAVTFIMRSPATPEMKLFLEKIYELPTPQVNELIAAANHGRAGHPAIMIVNSDEDLVNKVASIPGAVGVVDVYAINSSVAVVKLSGKLPLEPGYFLHGN
jgi:ABC-type phosphate transport system substrate-binding protein